VRRAWLLAGLPFLLALPAACGGSDGQTATAPPLANAARLHLVRVASFSSPVYVTSAPGDASRLYVVEQGAA
jgi:hypothetical protein